MSTAPKDTACSNCSVIGQWRHWDAVGFYICDACGAPAPWVIEAGKERESIRAKSAQEGSKKARANLMQFIWESREGCMDSTKRAQAEGWIEALTAPSTEEIK